MKARYTSPKLSLLTILRWQFSKRFGSPATQLHPPAEVMMLPQMPGGEYAIWMGHATLWMNIAGTAVVIDPVFGDIPLYRRHTPMPVPPEMLKADLILITHAHYDHYDRASVLMLLRRNPECIVVAPAGFWRYLGGIVERERCFEMEWWESVMVCGLFITFTPSLHWSKRTPFDTNKALWGGFVIQHNDRVLYHAGDSAYGPHFKEIGERFEIQEAFLPIGAYRPEAIMKHNHLNPAEAVQACIDLGAQTLIPIHYGTFILSDEPLDEPLQWFNRITSERPQPFQPHPLRIGEVYRFKATSTERST